MDLGYGARKVGPFTDLKVAGIKGNMSAILNVSSVGKRSSTAPNQSSWRALWLLTFMLGLFPLLWVTVSEGQTTSITASGLGTAIQHTTGSSTTNIRGGTLSTGNSNLFHSFAEFSIASNETALFQNLNGAGTAPLVSAPGSVSNIIGRVTGANPSKIYGTVNTQSGFSNASLFLINPQGIVVGPNASFTVGGSLHLSTADYLRLGSGNDRFYADLGKTSQLTSAAVTAFGFLAEGAKGPITVQAGQAGNPIAVSEGKALSLIGGDIAITGRTLSAPGGQINLASMAGAGEVVPNQAGQTPSLGLVNVSKQGTIQLTEGAIFRTSSTMGDAGPVFIRGGQLVMENAGIEAVTTAPRQFDSSFTVMTCCKGGIVDVVADSVLLKGSTGGVAGRTIYTNNQGDITFSANELTLDNAQIFTDGYNVPAPNMNRAGHIRVQGLEGTDSFANHVSLRNQTVLDSEGFFIDIGDHGRQGGHISVRATDIDLSNSKVLTNQGSINLEATRAIRGNGQNMIQNDFGVTANVSDHKGLVLKAGESISLTSGDKVAAVERASIHSAHFSPDNILITAPTLSFKATTVSADGGSLASAGDINIRGTDIVVSDGSVISTKTSGSDPLNGGGGAGHITISGMEQGVGAKTIQVLNDSKIISNGPSGNSYGVAGTISLEGGSIVFDAGHATVSHGGIGGSGKISIRGDNLLFTNNSSLEATTTGLDTIAPSPQGGSQLYPAANGGNLVIAGTNIVLAAHSTINTSSTGDGNAGAINLSSADSISIANSTVSTSAVAASGGNITLTAPNLVRLVGANLTSSVNGPANSNGGNITINTAHPQFVILQGNSQILAKANAGQGGAITIIGGVVLQEPGSVLDATAGPAGISGSINIQAPFQQLSGAIAPLPQAFAVATNLYGQRCAAEKGGQFSSFVQGARDGVPPQPGDLIPSPLMLELDEAPLGIGSQSSPSLAAIRLGLPEFEQTPYRSLTVFAGCRS